MRQSPILSIVGQDGEYCDPQLGCSSRLVGEDLSQERAQQFSQELRLASNFSGPLNFSVGANYLHYQTVEDYYVFINVLSMYEQWINQFQTGGWGTDAPHLPFDSAIANACNPKPADPATVLPITGIGCGWVDPNPIDHWTVKVITISAVKIRTSLNSWAGFGEAYYQVMPELKLTGGLRWTDDMKQFIEIPSWAAMPGRAILLPGLSISSGKNGRAGSSPIGRRSLISQIKR